jgi:hypothetical protein
LYFYPQEVTTSLKELKEKRKVYDELLKPRTTPIFVEVQGGHIGTTMGIPESLNYIFFNNIKTASTMSYNWMNVVRIISDKKELEKIALERAKRQQEVIEKITKLCNKKKSLLTRDIIPEALPGVDTRTNYYKYADSNCDKNDIFKDKINGIARNWNCTICCSGTKAAHDLFIQIPKMSLDFCGYTKTDLIKWLEFLKNSEIDFDYEYIGFGDSLYLNMSTEVVEKLIDNSRYCYTSNKNWHYIWLKGSNTNAQETYFRFILLRYLYNHQYYNIPAAAIQIKRALGDKVSNFQAILLGHWFCEHYEYYALSKYPNPFIEAKTLLGSFKDKTVSGMNSYFTGHHMPSFVELKKLFQNKDFEAVLNYFNKVYGKNNK